jgi:putative tryptophan/tyrosine transport system substrate-binding protein
MRGNPHSSDKSRARWMILVWFALIALVLSGCGADKPKVYRVGILSGLDFFASTADGFKAKMADFGYVEGQNIVYDMHKTNFEPEAERQILDKFVADKVDLILVFPTEPSLAAKKAIQGTNIPMLFVNTNVEGVDLINSVREPGGNITGVRFPGPDMAVKRLEIMHEVAPRVKRLWVPYQQGYPTIPLQLEVLRPAAAAAGITLVETPAADAAAIKADVQARAKAADIGVDGVLFIPEPLTVNPEAFASIAQFAAEHKLPLGGALMIQGDYSTTFGVSTDNIAVGKQAAILADKIFKGTPAGTIPVVSAENFLQINYKATQALGLTVPDPLLRQAAEVIR